MKENILVILFHSLSSRNLFTTDAIDALKNAQNKNFIFVVDQIKLDFYVNTYQSENIRFVGFDQRSINKSFHHKIFKNLDHLFLPTRAMVHKFQGIYDQKRNINSLIKYIFSTVLFYTLPKFTSLQSLIRFIEYKTYRKVPSIAELINYYAPKKIVATDIFGESEYQFLIEAKMRNIPTIGIVRSWDNCTNKGLLRTVPDITLLANDILKEESILLHNIPANSIQTFGFPQFDLAYSPMMNRVDFCKEMNIAPRKKIVLLSPAGQYVTDTDWQLCELIKKTQLEGKISNDVLFLVRVHPLDPAPLEQFVPNENFIIDRPGIKFGHRIKETELSLSDQIHLMNSLKHCDVLINLVSTISLDSLPFDKPQILVCFDGWEKKKYIDSIVHYQNDDHFIKFVETSAIKKVYSVTELAEQINKYLANPDLDSEQRKIAKLKYLQYLDGKCGERLGALLVKYI